MKRCFLLLLACVCAHGAPLAPEMKPGSCQDASALGAAGLALSKINENRKEGFIYSLHRLSNVYQMKHGETGTVFYLTLDVLETDCHVFSRKDSKSCEVRQMSDRPVYGRCKATIYINKVHRVVRLYNYDCVVRPASATKIASICPDCPSAMDKNHEEILKAASLSLDKFNKESGLAHYFAMLNITRAAAQMGMATFYNVDYTIQETTCANTTDLTQLSKCPLMDCEFAHKGHCKGSHSFSMGDEYINVNCEVFEPESAEKEKKLHLLGGETHHSHSDGHTHDHKHDHKHDAKGAHAHDHTHDHMHDHTKDHKHGPHGHEHDHDHDHAHNHTHDHTHLHGHEHHHHHHEHKTPQRQPVGRVTVLPALDRPVTLPSFPDQESMGPKEGVTLPVVPDPEIPGQREPTILPFPASISPQCPAPPKEKEGGDFMKILFAEDPLFKSA